jgi:HEAT repeat protein
MERGPNVGIAQTLLYPETDRRLAAVIVLSKRFELIAPADRDVIQQRLITALSDPHIHVRERAAGILHRLRTTEGEATLSRSLEGPDVTDAYYSLATGRKRPLPIGEINASTFSPETVTAISSIAPDFSTTLANRDDAAVRRLMVGIERSNNPETTPVLVWLLAHGDMRAYGGSIVKQLNESPHRARLSIPELARLLAGSDPDHRVVIAQLFAKLLQVQPRGADTSASDRDRDQIIAALIDRVGDPNIDVSSEAVRALGTARAANATDALISALDDRLDITREYGAAIIDVLGSIGSRGALPALESCARAAQASAVRRSAARAFIAIAKPADAGSERRRLLWEQPDTELEQQVLAQGRSALPRAHLALSLGTEPERHAAAALLGWFPDRRSIIPILIGLSCSPDPLKRIQLLFDLNMILWQEGAPRRCRAAQHPRSRASAMALRRHRETARRFRDPQDSPGSEDHRRVPGSCRCAVLG